MKVCACKNLNRFNLIILTQSSHSLAEEDFITSFNWREKPETAESELVALMDHLLNHYII